MKKSVYIDIDGTLAQFHDADKLFIEAMWTPGFYVNLKPFENFVEAVKLFIKQNPDVDVYVLSAVLDTEPPFVIGEKNDWLDKYLPEIDKEHRIFTHAGEDKSKYIDLSSSECFLIDDYNKNLYEFEAAGGNSIKFHNDINHRGLGEFGGSKGNLWEGAIIHYDKDPAVTCMNLEGLVGKIKDYDKFGFEDNILIEYKGNENIITIPNGVEVIDRNVFWQNTNLEKINFPKGLQAICSGAFADCKGLSEIDFPDNLKTLECNSFIGCSGLEKVSIPASVFYLHNQAFNCCENLNAINVDVNNDKYFSVNGIVFKYGKDINTLPELLRCPCGKSGSVELDDKIISIKSEAFMNCTFISNIKLPEQLFEIGSGAFYNCSSLESIVIPSNTKLLNDSIFAECINLKSVTIPDNIMSFGSGIFDGCKNLSEIIISDEALIAYCEKFNFLDEVFMTPCYKDLKERFESLSQNKSIDNLIEDANKRVAWHGEIVDDDYMK